MVQATPLFCGSSLTVGVNCIWVSAATLVGSGFGDVMATEITPIVNVTAANWVGSVTEVAVTVTEFGCGRVGRCGVSCGLAAGVVVGETVPQGLFAPAHEGPVMVQVTPRFCGSFVTVAVNCTWALNCTPFVVDGFELTLTVIAARALPPLPMHPEANPPASRETTSDSFLIKHPLSRTVPRRQRDPLRQKLRPGCRRRSTYTGQAKGIPPLFVGKLAGSRGDGRPPRGKVRPAALSVKHFI